MFRSMRLEIIIADIVKSAVKYLPSRIKQRETGGAMPGSILWLAAKPGHGLMRNPVRDIGRTEAVT